MLLPFLLLLLCGFLLLRSSDLRLAIVPIRRLHPIRKQLLNQIRKLVPRHRHNDIRQLGPHQIINAVLQHALDLVAAKGDGPFRVNDNHEIGEQRQDERLSSESGVEGRHFLDQGLFAGSAGGGRLAIRNALGVSLVGALLGVLQAQRHGLRDGAIQLPQQFDVILCTYRWYDRSNERNRKERVRDIVLQQICHMRTPRDVETINSRPNTQVKHDDAHIHIVAIIINLPI